MAMENINTYHGQSITLFVIDRSNHFSQQQEEQQ